MCPRGQFLQINFGNKAFYQLCEGQNDRKCAINCYNRYFSGQQDDTERDVTYWENWVHTRMNDTKNVVEKVAIFIAPSRYLLNRFVDDFNVPKDKITYLDYGFPTHYLSPIVDKKNTIFTFGYIGTHIPAKGINQLIEAFSTIKVKARLIIFGRDNGQSTLQLKELALKSFNKIEFKGEYINKNLTTDVFSQVDCIVVPSIWAENSPLVIHEAQACHIPVITANIGGMAEYVKHLENGLLFTQRNVESLIEQMNFAINNPNLMEKMGEIGYLQNESGLVPTIKQHCEQLELIYQQAIQQNDLTK